MAAEVWVSLIKMPVASLDMNLQFTFRGLGDESAEICG
jgi:hypothetical protein